MSDLEGGVVYQDYYISVSNCQRKKILELHFVKSYHYDVLVGYHI